MIDRILVPLDGSELGELALVYAKELAAVFRSEVHLVSVCDGRTAEYRRMIEVYIEKMAEQLRQDKDKPEAHVKALILDGNPADRILDYAGQNKINLIITVSHGHSGILPWTMGSTANKIVHRAHVSVLLIRAATANKFCRQTNVFRRILLPLDGSPVSERALPYALEIAKPLKSRLVLLSVVETGQRVHTIGGQDYIHFPEQQINAKKEELAAYLQRTAKKISENDVQVRVEVRVGNAAKEIIKLSKELRISLTTMTCHGKTSLEEWVFGSVSNKVLHHGKTPLLLVR